MIMRKAYIQMKCIQVIYLDGFVVSFFCVAFRVFRIVLQKQN